MAESLRAKVAIIIVNLGTPDEASPRAVKRYLGQFLSDRRVVEIPAILWQPILRGIILNTRPKKSARAYAEVWTQGGSPLAAITRATAAALDGKFGMDVRVDWAMRYGNPSVESRIAAAIDAGCTRILFAPLYPQYCAATTASANDALFSTIGVMRAQPAIRTLPPYHDDPLYIDALKASVERQVAALPFTPDLILASFHGMPLRTVALGDPYHSQCLNTARLLEAALGQPVRVTFQSRFGPAKWLGPATDTVLKGLPGEGVKKIAVVCPGFSADCLETLEEIAMRGRDDFLDAGGTDFACLTCLNDSEEGVAMLVPLLSREIGGWA